MENYTRIEQMDVGDIMSNFKPEEKQESDFGGKSAGKEYLLPLSDMWIWIKKLFIKPSPESENGQLNTEELEKIRQDKIDAAVDREMAETCNEDPKMREKLKNT